MLEYHTYTQTDQTKAVIHISCSILLSKRLNKQLNLL